MVEGNQGGIAAPVLIFSKIGESICTRRLYRLQPQGCRLWCAKRSLGVLACEPIDLAKNVPAAMEHGIFTFDSHRKLKVGKLHGIIISLA
jgi:hypothetical protein